MEFLRSLLPVCTDLICEYLEASTLMGVPNHNSHVLPCPPNSLMWILRSFPQVFSLWNGHTRKCTNLILAYAFKPKRCSCIKTGPYNYVSNAEGSGSFTNLLPNLHHPIWKDLTHLLIHIPKTGGLSIIKARKPSNVRLISFGHVQPMGFPAALLLKVRHKMYAIVRNPYDRLVSAYFFMKKRVDDDYFHDYREDLQLCPTFQKWALYLARQKRSRTSGWNATEPYWDIIQPQCHWTILIPVQNIGRMETLQEDVKRLFGIDDLPLHNFSYHDDYKQYYTDSTIRDAVFSLYEADFRLFGYSKNIT